MEGGEAGGGLLQQILSLRLVPRVGNGTTTYSSPLSTFPEMWYGVFLWALVSSLSFHVPAALLALFTLRHHKYGRFMSVSLLLMGIVGPITAGILTSTEDARKHGPSGPVVTTAHLRARATRWHALGQGGIKVLAIFTPPPAPVLKELEHYLSGALCWERQTCPWGHTARWAFGFLSSWRKTKCLCLQVGHICSWWAVE
ncbi:transmembrane protein 170A isoform X1 [Colius striatus]|uniref:transmembrane protein 170A isoform X1 n=1 Tax=Colius striatus TaxID=57412 RepID=UPI002B1CFB9B|nr:transmembrane protein 170A isoform X1 [Colius striatus]